MASDFNLIFYGGVAVLIIVVGYIVAYMYQRKDPLKVIANIAKTEEKEKLMRVKKLEKPIKIVEHDSGFEHIVMEIIQETDRKYMRDLLTFKCKDGRTLEWSVPNDKNYLVSPDPLRNIESDEYQIWHVYKSGITVYQDSKIKQLELKNKVLEQELSETSKTVKERSVTLAEERKNVRNVSGSFMQSRFGGHGYSPYTRRPWGGSSYGGGGGGGDSEEGGEE